MSIAHRPKPHQRQAVADTIKTLKGADRARVISACGTGKTLTQLWTAQALEPARILVLVPTLALVKQAHDEWERNSKWGAPFKSVFVCSDTTIATRRTRDRGRSLWNNRNNDQSTLTDLGLQGLATTDPCEINWQIDALGGTVDSPVVVFSTYASADMVGAAMKMRAEGDKGFDIGIFDEAHKTAGDEGKQDAFALSDANLEIRKRIFYTATPRVIVRRRSNDDDEDRIASMDDESLYGPLAHELSFAAAVAKGLIVDYKVVISIIDDNQAKEDFKFERRDIGRLIFDVGGEELNSRMIASHVVVKRTMLDFNLDKAILFHTSVDDAKSHEAFARKYRRLDDKSDLDARDWIRTYWVSGKQRMRKRIATMRAFRAPGRSSISHSRCLTEGIDVPAVDLVAFMDPKKSVVDIVQAVGRAMRTSPKKGKKFGYVLLPLHVQKGEQIDDVLQSQGFRKIADVLNALTANEAGLQGLFRSEMIKRGQAGKIIDGYGDIDEAAGELFSTYGQDDFMKSKLIIVAGGTTIAGSISCKAFISAFKARVLDRVGDGWDEMLGKYIEFRVDGKEPKFNLKDEAEKQIAQWVLRQRQVMKCGNLEQARINQLNAIKFRWDPFGESWMKNFNAYQKFKMDNKEPVKVSKNKDERRLAMWAHRQRAEKYNPDFDKVKIAKLNAIQFCWDVHGDGWTKQFKAYKRFRVDKFEPNEKYKNEAEKQLLTWVKTQRRAKSIGTLDQVRIDLLNSIKPNFIWDTRIDTWMKNVKAYSKFKVDGKEPSLNSKDEVELRLANWVNTQRQFVKRNKLDNAQLDQLNSIGFVYDPCVDAWMKKFESLKIFNANKKYPSKTSTNEVERHVAEWIGNQRRDAKQGKLDPDRRKQLESAGITLPPGPAAKSTPRKKAPVPATAVTTPKRNYRLRSAGMHQQSFPRQRREHT